MLRALTMDTSAAMRMFGDASVRSSAMHDLLQSALLMTAMGPHIACTLLMQLKLPYIDAQSHAHLHIIVHFLVRLLRHGGVMQQYGPEITPWMTLCVYPLHSCGQ